MLLICSGAERAEMERMRPFFFLARLIGRSCRLSATALTAFALGMPPSARALDAKSFDFDLRPAVGQRPLIAIWVRPPDETPATEIARRKQYYEDLFFGQPRHATAYPDQLRQLEPSVADFYRQASRALPRRERPRDRFWRRDAVAGPTWLLPAYSDRGRQTGVFVHDRL
jgi:hypothetical protein